MSIFLCGDTHGTTDVQKLRDFFGNPKIKCSKDDSYLIILGDTGICWDNAMHDNITRSFLDNLPVKILWLDGNHENFDKLGTYAVETWNGGKVQKISDNIIHLMRGQIYTIEKKKFFVFGGGNSIDKAYRIQGRSWWEQEMPTTSEYDEGLDNIEAAGYKVDYVLTHTCPYSIACKLVRVLYPGEEALQKYFEVISNDLKFKEWYFGHWHMDKDIGKFHALYNNVIKLK